MKQGYVSGFVFFLFSRLGKMETVQKIKLLFSSIFLNSEGSRDK